MTTVIEGTMAMEGAKVTTLATVVMGGAMAMAMEGSTAMQQQCWQWTALWRRRWMAQRPHDGDDGDGRRNGDRQRGSNNDRVRARIDAGRRRVEKGMTVVQPAGSSTKTT